jgi:hypothetical protein
MAVKYCFLLLDKHHRYTHCHICHKNGRKTDRYYNILVYSFRCAWAQSLKIHTKIVIHRNKQQETSLKVDTITSKFGLLSSFRLFSRVYSRFLEYEAPIAIYA